MTVFKFLTQILSKKKCRKNLNYKKITIGQCFKIKLKKKMNIRYVEQLKNIKNAILL